MTDDYFAQLASDYQQITGMILNSRMTNRIEEGVHRRDSEFSNMAGFFFDHHAKIPLMKIKLAWHMTRHENEQTCALMAYMHYICEEFSEALPLFFRCITLNPENLDNWLDCAFCLHHLENEYAYHIIYNYDEFIRKYREIRCSVCDLSALRKIYRAIVGEKRDYAVHIGEYYRFLTSREGSLADFLKTEEQR